MQRNLYSRDLSFRKFPDVCYLNHEFVKLLLKQQTRQQQNDLTKVFQLYVVNVRLTNKSLAYIEIKNVFAYVLVPAVKNWAVGT